MSKKKTTPAKTKIYRIDDNGNAIEIKTNGTQAPAQTLHEHFGKAQAHINKVFQPLKDLQETLTPPVFLEFEKRFQTLENIKNPIAKDLFKSGFDILAKQNLLQEQIKAWQMPIIEYQRILSDIQKSIKEFEKETEARKRDIPLSEQAEIKRLRIELKKKQSQLQAKEQENAKIKQENAEIKAENKTLKNILVNKVINVSDKPQPKPKRNVKVLVNIIDDDKAIIQAIYNKMQPFFIADLKQWELFFSNEIKPFEAPIQLKDNAHLTELRYFINKLVQAELIKKNPIKLITELKIFKYKGYPVTTKQLYEAQRTLKKAELKENRKNIIDDIFYNLRLITEAETYKKRKQ